MQLAPEIVDELLAANILANRTARSRDTMRESVALDQLIGRINSHPEQSLQALVDTAADLSDAGSAGVSLPEGDRFVWRVIAGALAPHAGQGMPLNAAPCALVVERDEALLFRAPHDRFPQFSTDPPIEEALLVPLRLLRRPIGTLWVLSHDQHRFDTEDVRILERLGLFATALDQFGQGRLESAAAKADARARIKQTIELIRSVTRAAIDSAPDLLENEGLTRFGSRISAYADAARAGDIPSDLWLLIADTLQRQALSPGERVVVEGPHAAIPSEQAGLLGLVFHELLDNAYRYGALSTEDGVITILWTIEQEGDQQWVHLSWNERGTSRGPDDGARSAFGFELLTVGLPEMLGARTNAEWQSSGLELSIDFPLKQRHET